jgi:hypothetical protein
MRLLVERRLVAQDVRWGKEIPGEAMIIGDDDVEELPDRGTVSGR